MPESPVRYEHYEIQLNEDGTLCQLGAGGMGTTYRAYDTRLRKVVALKIIASKLLADAANRRRFFNEARAAALIDHPNVARVLYLCPEEAPECFFAMELVPGEPLSSRVARYGPLPAGEALLTLRPVVEALGALAEHALVHRDIKPDNIMLLRTGPVGARVKLIDFGLAKSLDEASAHFQSVDTGERFVGSTYFASPEQIRPRAGTPVDTRSDFYSLGATLWAVLTGFPPFTGTVFEVQEGHVYREPPWERIAPLPPPLSKLLHRLLAKDPAERPQTAAALAEEWDATIEGLKAYPPVPPLHVSIVGGEGTMDAPTMPHQATVAPETAPPQRSEPAPPSPFVPVVPPAPAPVQDAGGSSRRWLAGISALLLLVAGGGWWMSRKNDVKPAGAPATPGAGPLENTPAPTPVVRETPAGQSPVAKPAGDAEEAAAALAKAKEAQAKVDAQIAPLMKIAQQEQREMEALARAKEAREKAAAEKVVPPSKAALPAGLLSPPTASKDAPFVNSLGMKFVPVPGTNVLFSTFETRVADYAQFVAATKHEQKAADFPQEPSHPAINVSYEDAEAFCRWLSEKENRHYRLPTDLEWSAAVGLSGEKGETPEDRTLAADPLRFPWGEWPPPKGTGNFADQTTFRMKAWPDAIPDYDDGFAYTAPVGSFPPNTLGIYDLSGNAEEWCEDWNNQLMRHRVYRGGGWADAQKYPLTAGVRLSAAPDNRLPTYGFRCVLDLRK